MGEESYSDKYRRLDDDDILELLRNGPTAFMPEAWQALTQEWERRKRLPPREPEILQPGDEADDSAPFLDETWEVPPYLLDELRERRGEDIRPLWQVPTLMRVNGFGTTLLGRSDEDPLTDTYVTTVWFTAFWLPALPRGRYRVRQNARHPDQYWFVGQLPLRLIDFGIPVLVGIVVDLAIRAFAGAQSGFAFGMFAGVGLVASVIAVVSQLPLVRVQEHKDALRSPAGRSPVGLSRPDAELAHSRTQMRIGEELERLERELLELEQDYEELPQKLKVSRAVRDSYEEQRRELARRMDQIRRHTNP